MNLEEKKSILLSIIAATKKEDVIDELISIGWAKELEPVRSIKQLPSDINYQKKRKGSYGPVHVHGRTFKSVRAACKIGWGMSEKEYNTIVKKIAAENVELEDLLPAPLNKTVIQKTRLPVDHSGLVKIDKTWNG